MPISSYHLPLSFRTVRVLTVAFALAMPMVARADFAKDAQEPLRLLQAEQFDKAVVALEKIAPRNQSQFGLHYLMGLARMGRLKDNMKAAQVIQILQQSRQSLLKAQQLATTKQEKKETLELLTVAEEGLRDLGVPVKKAAPPKAAPSVKSKDKEIEDLKRRLAELQAKPAPAKPATPRPAAVKPNSTSLPTPSRRAGHVVGRVLDSAGKPMVGAEINIYGNTVSGDRARFETVSGAGGLFSQRVPDGIYGVGAQWKTRYNEKNYLFDLNPDDGKTGAVHDAGEGIVKNFTWKIAGLKPGERAGEPNTHSERSKYYGAQLSVSVEGHGEAGEVVYFPRGSTLVMTLTPRTTLIDGSVGTPQVFRRVMETDATNQRYFTWYPGNIPIGLYNLSVQLVGADGTVTPLNAKRSLPFNEPFTSTVPVDFEPDQFERVQMVQITIEAPRVPAK